MAFDIKVWTFPYCDVKKHIFMVVPLSRGAIRNVKKTVLIILIGF